MWANEAVDDVVEVRLPANHRIRQLPKLVSFDSPVLSYRVEWSGEERSLVLKRSFTINQNRVPASNVGEVRKALAGYFRALEARVLLSTVAAPVAKQPASVPSSRL